METKRKLTEEEVDVIIGKYQPGLLEFPQKWSDWDYVKHYLAELIQENSELKIGFSKKCRDYSVLQSMKGIL